MLRHKFYLIVLKYIPHVVSFLYMIYTIFQFLSIDLFILGRLIHISAFAWLFMLLSSITFKYCYVHRLPLYYILLNDLLTDVDYYFGIPVSDIGILLLHLILIILTIYGYSYYHIKCKVNVKDIEKSTVIDNQ